MSENINEAMKKFVHNLKKDLQTINQHKFGLIFTGLTGSGKGALIHFLMKNSRLYAQMQDTGDIIISLKRNLNGAHQKISISNKMSSDTSIPNQTQYKGLVFRDLPGFMDNRDNQKYIPQDIINSFFMHEVYAKTKHLKIIFICSKNSLTDRATQFIKSLNYFTQRFQNIQQVLKSVFLVVSKVPVSLQIKHIKFILNKILKDLSNEIPQKSKKLLDLWIQDQNLMQLFRIPEKQGSLNFVEAEIILQKIKKIPYSQSPKIKNIISEHSQAKMTQIQDKLNSVISQIGYQLVQTTYKQYLRKISKIKDLNKTKSNLNYLRHQIDLLMGTQTSQQFRQRLKNIKLAQKQKTHQTSQSIWIQFQEDFQFLQLFAKLQPKIYNVVKWKEPLYKISHNISQLVSEPWEEVHGSDIYVKGFVVYSSSIQKKVSLFKTMNQLSNIKTQKIVVFAYFFIMDVELQYKGASMMIYCQQFIVQDSFLKISLNGQNAIDYGVTGADYNQNGQPGRPGQNGGNLLLRVYQTCEDLKNFCVNLRGGKGGRGKDGGELKNKKIKNYYLEQLRKEKNLPTNQKRYLQYRQDYKFSQRNIFSKAGQILRILGTYNGQVVQFYSTQVQISSNLNYFQHTLGGAGGKAGHSGTFHVDIGAKQICVIDAPQQSINGLGHVQVYQGLYVKQMIFPNFREQGKQMNRKKMIQQSNLRKQNQRIERQMAYRRQRNIDKSIKIIDQKRKQQEQKKKNEQFLNIQNKLKLNIKQIIKQTSNQLMQEDELSTPLKYKAKYKEQIQYDNQDSIIQEQDNQEDTLYNLRQPIKQRNTNYLKDSKINASDEKPYRNLKYQNNEPYNFNELRKESFPSDKPVKLEKMPTLHFQRRSNQQNKKNSSLNKMLNSSSSSKISLSSSSINSINSKPNLRVQKIDTYNRKSLNPLINPKKNINPQLKLDEKPIQAKQVINQLGMNVATDIGTGAAEKFAQRIINKVCQKIVRNGFTMEKQVLKQLVQNSLKSQTQKKLLANLGIFTGQGLTKQIAKAAASKIQQNVITNVGKQIIRDSALVLQRQAFKHISEDLIKQNIKLFGKQATREAQIQLAAKSIGSGTVYAEGMMSGLAKSLIFQIFLSVLMASGITDRWIIQPHFKSKLLDLKVYNQQGIQQPEPYQDFTIEQMKRTQQQYKFFIQNFSQFKSVFFTKKS